MSDLLIRIQDNQSIGEYFNHALKLNRDCTKDGKERIDGLKAYLLFLVVKGMYRQDGHTNRVGIPALSEKCSYKEFFMLTSTTSFILNTLKKHMSDEKDKKIESFMRGTIQYITDDVFDSQYWDNLVLKVRKNCTEKYIPFQECLKVYNEILNTFIQDMDAGNILEIPEFFSCPKKMEQNFMTSEEEDFVDGRELLKKSTK